MATTTVRQARYVGNVYGNSKIRGGPEEPDIKETASQTYGIGAPVYRDTNGTIAVATASSNIVQRLAGFAMVAASGTTGTSVRYRAILPGDQYVLNTKGPTTTVSALTDVDNKAMLDLSSGNLVLNLDATFDATKPYVVVQKNYTTANGFPDGDTVGDTNGLNLVMFPDQESLQG